MSVQIQKLLTNLLHEFWAWLQSEELVVESIATSHNLDVVDVMTVDCGQSNATVIHLSSENLITVEPITENTAVTVRWV